jgi:hypothetical protein
VTLGFPNRRSPVLGRRTPWTRPTRLATPTRCAAWPRRRSPAKRRHDASGPTTRPPSTATRRPRPRRPTTPRPLPRPQQLAAEVFGAEGAELAAGLTWTAVGTGQATATIDEHVLVYHRTPIVWTRARAANSPLGQSWWPTADGTRPPQHRRLGPSLGLRRRCGCGQQLGYGPFTWDTNYPHQGPMKETANEPHRSVRP